MASESDVHIRWHRSDDARLEKHTRLLADLDRRLAVVERELRIRAQRDANAWRDHLAALDRAERIAEARNLRKGIL